MELAAGSTSFDVICAGDALWTFRRGSIARLAEAIARQFQPGGGAVRAAFSLASRGLRVGLSTVLTDDRAGRALVQRVSAAGISVGGVRLSTSRGGLVMAEGGAAGLELVPSRSEEQPIAIPETWSAPVLLLSGVSPHVASGAALCREARRARRSGTTVVVDANAKWHLWAGRDGRVVRSLVREADVVRCTGADLAVLGTSRDDLRLAMRPNAVLVTTDEDETRVSGPFGDLALASRARPEADTNDETIASICAELARAGRGPEATSIWHRALAN